MAVQHDKRLRVRVVFGPRKDVYAYHRRHSTCTLLPASTTDRMVFVGSSVDLTFFSSLFSWAGQSYYPNINQIEIARLGNNGPLLAVIR